MHNANQERAVGFQGTRRQALQRFGTGIGALAMAGLLADKGGFCARAAAAEYVADGLPWSPKQPHFEASAKQVVHIFMNGGPSHVDTFDPKPSLDRYHGKPLPMANLVTERTTGAAMRSPFRFRKYGESGIEVSELFSRTAVHMDDIAVIRSMQADVPNHEPSLMLMNCGDSILSRPSFGSWITYGLGSENQNLPGFIAMCPRGFPVAAKKNWRSAFLPGAYQGTYVNPALQDSERLIANITNGELSREEQRRQLDLVHFYNQRHRETRQHDARLEARLQTFELAYRMQAEATDAFDVNNEPQYIQQQYGEGMPSRQLLIARRLLERGVRFIQVWSGEGQPWDAHGDLEENHRELARGWDVAIAGFLKDLKQRGLLETTLVLWGGEFGRTPVAELPSLSGRDHNHYGFSVWLAGGGIRGGYVHGATDEFGFQAVDSPVHVHDLHATMLHLLGLDHERLTYRYAGRDFRLTDVYGNVVHNLIQ